MNFYILAFLFLFTVSQSSPLPGIHADPKREMTDPARVVFKSADGGQSWEDISKGLPEKVREGGIRGNSFFVNDNGLYLGVGNGMYYSNSNSKDPFWKKEIFPSEPSSIRSGIPPNDYWAVNLKKADGTSVWSPIFDNFHEQRIRSVFETAGGTIFVGIDRGIFRSTDNGKTWKHVHKGLFAGHMAESDGVLVAASMKRLIRSTDNGENWEFVTSEDSVAFDVKVIKGGFAAITSNSETNSPKTSRLSTSYDGGKTWQPIHAGVADKAFADSIFRTWDDRPVTKAFQTSIIKVGENFLSIHAEGIFRSSDKGKTWKLLLPATDDKIFGLYFSGNVIYAISVTRGAGC